jgi:hypothetical protein
MQRRKLRNDNGYAISRDLTPQQVPVADCKPLGRATRKHSPEQVRRVVQLSLCATLEEFELTRAARPPLRLPSADRRDVEIG